MPDSLADLDRLRDGDGDGEAVEALLLRHLPGLRGFLQQQAGEALRKRETVSDLVQSTFREVLQDVGDVRFETEEHFKNWLYQAALRKVVDRGRHWKAEKRDMGREALDPVGESDGAGPVADRILLSLADVVGTPSRAAAGREDVRRLEACLRQLPKDQRDLILMVRVLGLPYGEISKKTGKSEGTLRVQLSRALAELRSKWERG